LQNTYRNLHGRCSILIAANSVSIIFYSFTFFTQLLMSIFDPTAQGIPASRCLAYMAVPLFFSNCQFVLFPTIALDRLLGALFPLWFCI
jgi:hypothetical protein